MKTDLLLGHTSDSHVIEGPRLGEILRCLDFVIDDGNARGVELWTHPGDWTGKHVPHRMTTVERNSITPRVQRMANQAPVVIAYGNHDYPGDLDYLAELKARHPIYVVDRPAILNSSSNPGLPEHVKIYVLPFPKKGWLLAGGDVPGIEGQHAAMGRGLRGLLDHWRLDAADWPGVRLGMGHITTIACKLAGGERIMEPGREIELGRHDYDQLGFDYGALGHIHTYQQVADAWFYCGNQCRGDFGETDPKGYIVAQIRRGELPQVEHRLSPARRFVTIDIEATDPGALVEAVAAQAAEHALDGTEVRVRLNVPEAVMAQLDKGRLEEAYRAAGAVPQIETVTIPTERRRDGAAEIGTATTTDAKLRCYFASLGEQSPPEEQIARVLDLRARLAMGIPHAA